MQDGQTTTNEQGGKQSSLSANFTAIPPTVLRLLAQCLGFGLRKYGFENWKKIPQEDHISHSMNHLIEYRLGDRSEPHLVNALARTTFALQQAVESGDQASTYIHPDMQRENQEEITLIEVSLDDIKDYYSVKIDTITDQAPRVICKTDKLVSTGVVDPKTCNRQFIVHTGNKSPFTVFLPPTSLEFHFYDKVETNEDL